MNNNFKLLAIDLAGRIPYGVKCQMNIGDGDYFVDTLYYVTLDGCVYLLGDKDEIEYVLGQCDIKPYLFPLSSMTEEQEKEFLYTLTSDGNITYDTVDWVNKNHFDYRGLIELGLAIDCTNLNIY